MNTSIINRNTINSISDYINWNENHADYGDFTDGLIETAQEILEIIKKEWLYNAINNAIQDITNKFLFKNPNEYQMGGHEALNDIINIIYENE